MTAHRPPWFRLTVAAVAGVLWGCSFAKPGIAGFAWAVPGLLLLATAGADRGTAFRAAYLAGLVHHLISLSWLRFIPFPAGAFAGWFTLSLVLSLFPAAWCLVCLRFARMLGVTPEAPFNWRRLAEHFQGRPWARLNLWFVLCAAAWVTWEMALARVLGGFPWNLLGVSQHRMLPLIQIASATGVYGVSFVIVWFSTSLLAATLLLACDPDRTAAWRRPLVFSVLMVVAVAGSGFLAILGDRPAPRQIRIALVQPAIPQTVIFDPAAATNRFDTLLRLTEQALEMEPDLVVWPEASLPGGLSREDFERLTARIRTARVWMVFGSDEVEEAPGPGGEALTRAFNSAFLVSTNGVVAGNYRKQRLVMFGEYIPFGRWLPFLQRLAPIGDGFDAGDRPVPFSLESLDVTTSVLICFEDNFPQQARRHAPVGTDFLINITNDGWFGRSAAQWQHAANAAFRAIENGIPLVRCSNNGISCWIDPRGRFHSTRLAEGRDVYDPGFEVLTVEFGSPGSTFYNRYGDVFGWCCVAATLPALVPRGRRRA